MKKVHYEHVDTFAEASLIILTYENARLIAWEHNMQFKGYMVAIESEYEN